MNIIEAQPPQSPGTVFRRNDRDTFDDFLRRGPIKMIEMVMRYQQNIVACQSGERQREILKGIPSQIRY
jgi:hypothetical protein